MIHTDSPTLPDGVYDVDLDGIGPRGNVRVYCDMTTAGGGWTLVARSVTGGTAAAFGWKRATGSVDSDAAPYSMGPPASDIAFSELLVTSHAGTKVPTANAYLVPTGGNFIGSHGQTSLKSESSTAVGACSPTTYVAMLLFKGQTDLAGTFWFRDYDFVGAIPYGLYPYGWELYWSDCPMGGMLHLQQGMIFVR